MATSLARQLERLAAPQTALVVHKKSRPSLLFDKREAALLDRDTVFAIGTDGFEDLLSLEPALIKYQDALFSESSKTIERSVQTQAVNDQLDEVLEGFLCHMCPFFLLKPAQKAIEWLIYRFHIHEFNVNALLRCIFPYHDTNIFVRALQLLRVKEETNRWHWLYPLQNPGLPLSKAALAKHCAENLGFMKFLCVMNKKMIKVHGTSATSLHAPVAFFVTALTAGLERCHAVSEPQVALLVPHMLRCLASPLLELRAGGFMLVGQLSRRATLSSDLTDTLFTALAKHLTQGLEAQCVTALAVLAQTQQLALAPTAALELLSASSSQLTAALSELSQRCSVLQLVSCLLKTCLLQSARGDDAAAAMVTALASDVRMEVPREQEQLICGVVELFTGGGPAPAGVAAAALLSVLCPVLTAMERQYPAPFDAALGRLSGRGPATGRLGSLLAALRGQVGGAVGCGVFVDLNHPDESTRHGAVKKLMKSLREDKVSDKELVRSALLSSLSDESDRIVKQALKVPVEQMLTMVDPQELEDRLTVCLDSGHGDGVAALCARALSVLHAAAEPDRPVNAALLTYLLPAVWTEATPHQLSKVLTHLEPTLAAVLDQKPVCDRAVYIEAALNHLAERLNGLARPARAATLTALAGRAAAAAATAGSDSLPAAGRVAAAALAAACLRRDGDGAAETMAPLLPLLETAQLKVTEPLADLTPLELLRTEPTLPEALLCLLKAIIDTVDEKDVTTPWRVEGPSDCLPALYRSAAAGLSLPRSRCRPLCQAVVAALFKARLGSLPEQVAFLAQFWWTPSETPPPAVLAAQVAALVMAAALLKAAPASRLPPLLTPAACLLPSLLVALQSPLAQVRSAAVDCVRKIASVKVAKAKAPLLALATQLATRHQEIVSDPEEVARCMAEGGRDWLRPLVAVVVSDAVPDRVRSSLAALLPPLADEETVASCTPVLSDLILEVCAGRVLTSARSALAARLLRLFSADTAASLARPAVWRVFSDALSAASAGLLPPDGAVSPQSLLLPQVTRQLFAALDGDKQQQLLTLLVDLCTDTQLPDIATRIHRVVKRLPLTTEQLALQLGEEQVEKKTVRESRASRRRTAAAAAAPAAPDSAPPADDPLDGRPWRRRAVCLELLQARRRLDAPVDLLAPLFSLLRRLLRRPDQPAIEYHRQLALTCLQHVCRALADLDGPPPEALQAHFSVETLVQCVRSSNCPQTHQLALIILGMAAAMLPEMVLHNIMAIFTFMGSAMLRQDNEYSFRVIEKTVESIIPALLKASSLVSPDSEVLVSVLRVFVDAVRDVPRHRRLPLFSHLLRTVGEERHLWLCLVMLADQLATRGDARDKLAEDTVTVTGDKSVPQLVEFAASLCGEFPLHVQLVNCSRLLEHTEALVELRHDDGGSPSDKRRHSKPKSAPISVDPALFSLDTHSDKQFYKYCHTAVGLIAHLLGSETFVAQSAALDEAGAAAAQQQHQLLLERAVRLITCCARLCQTTLRGRDDDVRHVRAILHRLYGLLDKVNSLLPSAMFLSVVSGLLHSQLSVVRRRAMELLSTRLQLQADYFTQQDSDALLAITSELVTVAVTPDVESDQEAESVVSRQTALYALKLLSRLLATQHPAHMVPVLRAVCDLATQQALPAALLASCLLCMAELCASLRAHAIGRLPAMAAALLDVLADRDRLSNELVLVSAVTLTQKLVESLPHFVSPYLAQLLRHVCRLSAEHASRGSSSPLQHRLKQTRHQLATAVPTRVLVPAVDQCFGELTTEGSVGVSQLMAVLAECVASAEQTQLSAMLTELQALVLRCLEFRGSAADSAPRTADVEGDVIGAVTSLVPRLSETTFRPFFLRLCDWATRADAPPSRVITFYRLADALADRLKGLFVLFAGHFVRHLATALEGCNSISESRLFPDDEASSCELADYAIDCLGKVCGHDTEGFLTKERFQALMQPLVDQLENTAGSAERRQARLKRRLVPCLVNFLVAAGDDSLWKLANYQILLKMRHQAAEVRLAAISTLEAVHTRLGDDYMTLLPETMPFLAELLEDEEPVVEAACQQLIQQMEQTLGESLQKYF